MIALLPYCLIALLRWRVKPRASVVGASVLRKGAPSQGNPSVAKRSVPKPTRSVILSNETKGAPLNRGIRYSDNKAIPCLCA